MTTNGEKRGLTGVRWYNGSEIDPKAEVTGVMHNFTLGFVETRYSIRRIKSFGIVRDIFEAYLREKKIIAKNWQLLNPLQPRMIIKVVKSVPKE